MSDYTATCYGISGDNKYTDRTTAALGKNKDPNKGQKCVRVGIAAENEITELEHLLEEQRGNLFNKAEEISNTKNDYYT